MSPGKDYSNDDICEAFRCAPQGGMRRSKRTNTLVIVSNHVKSIYDDRWIDGTLFYTGMGSIGDQVLVGNQNITLFESSSNGVAVHLFEVFKSKIYTYKGEIKLSDSPFQEKQTDVKGRTRKVWVFPLVLQDKSDPISRAEFDELLQAKVKKSQKLSLSELEDRINNSTNKVGSRVSTVKVYQRSPYIIDYTLRRAHGICELCDQEAPFSKPNGEYYLEVHHIKRLADGGDDTIRNTVALCPNCHRKVHSLKHKSDIKVLKNKTNLIK